RPGRGGGVGGPGGAARLAGRGCVHQGRVRGGGGGGGERARGAGGAGGGDGGSGGGGGGGGGLLARRPGLLVLVDPSRSGPAQAGELARAARAAGAAGVMIGSSFDGTQDTQLVARAIREAAPELPLALFPGSALQLTDAVDL